MYRLDILYLSHLLNFEVLYFFLLLLCLGKAETIFKQIKLIFLFLKKKTLTIMYLVLISSMN